MTAAITLIALFAFLGWCEWLDYKKQQNNSEDDA